MPILLNISLWVDIFFYSRPSILCPCFHKKIKIAYTPVTLCLPLKFLLNYNFNTSGHFAIAHYLTQKLSQFD